LKRLNKLIVVAHEQHPQDFETLLGLRGIVPATNPQSVAAGGDHFSSPRVAP